MCYLAPWTLLWQLGTKSALHHVNGTKGDVTQSGQRTSEHIGWEGAEQQLAWAVYSRPSPLLLKLQRITTGLSKLRCCSQVGRKSIRAMLSVKVSFTLGVDSNTTSSFRKWKLNPHLLFRKSDSFHILLVGGDISIVHAALSLCWVRRWQSYGAMSANSGKPVQMCEVEAYLQDCFLVFLMLRVPVFLLAKTHSGLFPTQSKLTVVISQFPKPPSSLHQAHLPVKNIINEYLYSWLC